MPAIGPNRCTIGVLLGQLKEKFDFDFTQIPCHPYRDLGPGNDGMVMDRLGRTVQSNLINYSKEQGWYVCGHSDSIYFIPFVYVMPCKDLYHLTAAANFMRIRDEGLLPGKFSGNSTTNRPEAAEYIHVNFTEEEAKKWTSHDCLGQHNPSGEWVIFKFPSSILTKRVFRDPASDDYCLEDRLIEPCYLEEIRRFKT